MRQAAYDAISRYQLMAGNLEGVPEKAEQQGERDRDRFGEEYLALGEDGQPLWHPLKRIRFLAEVCGIPLQEAREAVIEDALATGVGMTGTNWPPSEEQARKLFETFGNILEARAYANFLTDLLAADERAARYWQDVGEAIESASFVPEDTGASWE